MEDEEMNINIRVVLGVVAVVGAIFLVTRNDTDVPPLGQSSGKHATPISKAVAFQTTESEAVRCNDRHIIAKLEGPPCPVNDPIGASNPGEPWDPALVPESLPSDFNQD